jgi:hypothetical protein
MPGLLAFFKRTLREHSRSGALVLTRTALALTLLICLALFSLWASTLGAAGLEFFHTVIVVNALFITAGGCTYFASAIAEEKEDGTLQLLRISRVSSLAVLLGKGGSRMLDGFLLLAVQMPFTLIGITLGGITWVQVAAAYATLAAYLSLVCAMGLLAGVLARRTGEAVLLAGLAVCLILFGGGFAAALKLHFPDTVFTRLSMITTTNFDGPIFDRWCGTCVLAGGVLFLIAWLLFDRFCSESGAPRLAAAGRVQQERMLIGRAPVLDLIQWKDGYFLHRTPGGSRRRRLAYGLVALLLGLDLIVSWKLHSVSHILAFWGLRVLAGALIAIYLEWLLATARAFSVEQQEHTLASLMILPGQTAGTLLAAKMKVIPTLLHDTLPFVWAGLGLIFLGTVIESADAIGFLMSAPVVVAIFVPLFWSQGVCLQRLVLHFSLRVRTGAMPLAMGVWLLGNLAVWLLLVLFGNALFLFGSLVGIFALIVPAAIAASILREKNLALIEAAAEQD